MLILLTFAESDGVSHALSPQPGRREEELTGVKTEKPLKKNIAATSLPLHQGTFAWHAHKRGLPAAL